jgi:hypothetical protein
MHIRIWKRWYDELLRKAAERKKREGWSPDDDTPMPTGLSKEEEAAQDDPAFFSRRY